MDDDNFIDPKDSPEEEGFPEDIGKLLMEEPDDDLENYNDEGFSY